ncbi:hypothetical protein V8G54_035318 [Vigna mungo]|uniref:Uncharacterized protein n=1 Tax=Vigna mungo TaxID=3915 RepID=A0AAQ3MGC6_VIGMU
MKNIELEEAIKKNLTVIGGLRNEKAKLTNEKVGDKNALDVLNKKNIELKERVKRDSAIIMKLRYENAKLTDKKVEDKNALDVGGKNALDVLNKKNIDLEEAIRKSLTLIEGLRNENTKLTNEKVEDKNDPDGLIMKNIELDEALKNNLTIIKRLRNENAKFTDEKHEFKTFFESLERRYSKLRVSYVKVEESTHCSVDTSNAQSTKKGNKEDDVGTLGVKFKLEKEIVDLGDDDNDARCAREESKDHVMSLFKTPGMPLQGREWKGSIWIFKKIIAIKKSFNLKFPDEMKSCRWPWEAKRKEGATSMKEGATSFWWPVTAIVADDGNGGQ